jgi:HAD superfamily phosphatase (TIGR01668 family)
VVRPDIQVTSVTDVTPALLARLGVQGVLVDLDDTLVASDADDLSAEAEAWVASLRDAGIEVAILSNGERARVRRLGERIGVPAFALVGKPCAFRKGLAARGTPREATAMVGDQLFTDVLGANCAGITSILVRPLTPGKLPHTRAARRLERLILSGGSRGSPVDR